MTGSARWLHLAAMFVFALEIPVLSQVALLGAATVATWGLFEVRTRFASVLWRLALLVMAMAAYFYLTTGHGFVPVLPAFARGTLAVAAYVTGYWAGHHDRASHARGVLSGTLAAVFGSVAYVLLCVRLALARGLLQAGSLAAVEDRWAPDPWGEGRALNAPGLGALAALGMALLPSLLLTPRLERRGSWLLPLAVSAAIAGGFYSNVVLQNRTPFVATVAALLLCLAAFFGSRLAHPAGKLAAAFLLSGLSLAALVAVQSGWVEHFGVLQRFELEGMRTSRYDLWAGVLSGLFDHIDGGRATHLPEAFAHNLWLDVAWETGPIPFFLLAAFHLSHVVPILVALRRLSLPARLVVIGVGVSLLVTSAAEPVLHISIGVFTLQCYLLGLLLAVSHWLPREPAPAELGRAA